MVKMNKNKKSILLDKREVKLALQMKENLKKRKALLKAKKKNKI